MIQNTVQTLVDYIRDDLTGQENASDEKVVRLLNFAVDHLSYIKLLAASKSNPDSSNHTNTTRTTVTTSQAVLSLSGGDLDVGEVLTFRHVEVKQGDTYTRLKTIDSRDADYEYVQSATGVPEYFDVEGNTLRILPKPSGSYTYRLVYGRVHPRFSADNLTQSTGLLPNEEEYVALYAADRLMIGTNDPSRTQVRQELPIKQKEIEKMTGLRDQSSSKRIKPLRATLSRNSFRTR